MRSSLPSSGVEPTATKTNVVGDDMDSVLRFIDTIAMMSITWNLVVLFMTLHAEWRYNSSANMVNRLMDLGRGIKRVFNFHMPLLYIAIATAWILARRPF